MALGTSLLLYTFQALQDDKEDVPPDIQKHNASFATSAQLLPSEAVSIRSFIEYIQHPPLHSNPFFVTSIEWRSEPRKRLAYEYVVIYVSDSVQSAPTIAIRVDRQGNLGVKTPWWHLRPLYLFAKTKRVSTSVLARPTGDTITDSATDTSVLKYTHWTHAIPPSAPISDLKRGLERARNNACTALNHTIRPYISHGLLLSEKQTRHGRRWADSRGLQFSHTDIAEALAHSMDTSIWRAVEALWAEILPSWLVWRSAQKSANIRQGYSRTVNEYRRQLLRLVHSVSSLDSETRSKIILSWGVSETEKSPSALVQFLTGSLSNHAFISPHTPLATLADVASRLDTLCSILPTFGPAQDLCELHAETLMARLSDKLWHAYGVSPPSVPASNSHAIRRRARNSGMFWLLVDIFAQWLVALLLLPKDGPGGLLLTCTVLYHTFFLFVWTVRTSKVWRAIWKAYECGISQDQDEMEGESGTLSSLWSQSKSSLWSTKWDSRYMEIPLAVLG